MRDDDEQLDQREQARSRRRDREQSAAARRGMRSGAAKLFKQIADAADRRDAATLARRRRKD